MEGQFKVLDFKLLLELSGVRRVVQTRELKRTTTTTATRTPPNKMFNEENNSGARALLIFSLPRSAK